MALSTVDTWDLPAEEAARVRSGRRPSIPDLSKKTRLITPDPDGLEEYSVVYTNRALNHMSQKFQGVMKDISATLKSVYAAESVALVPGSGTYAMEAVARQYATGRKCMVIRNGYFSYRWSQIFEFGNIPSEEVVLKARPVDDSDQPAYEPCPLEEVVAAIRANRPDVVFAPHVETSAGMVLPDDYLKVVAAAVHEVGGLFVLDCIASGCLWVDMKQVGVDVLITAPQKGWSGSPCAGVVMLSAEARRRLEETRSTVFAIDLKKWVAVMEAYEAGGHMYHTTMPTDAIYTFWEVQQETAAYGFQRAKEEQLALGDAMRRVLTQRGFKSVAAKGFQAPCVVVLYTDDPEMKTGVKFARQGIQTAAGVPLMVDSFTESAQFLTFRLGLFGLDKLRDMDQTVRRFAGALDRAQKPAEDAQAARAPFSRL